jgi:hypothetical protein
MTEGTYRLALNLVAFIVPPVFAFLPITILRNCLRRLSADVGMNQNIDSVYKGVDISANHNADSTNPLKNSSNKRE